MLNKIHKQAFTLIEILVVVMIIAVLSGVILVGINNVTQSGNIAKSQLFAVSVLNTLSDNVISGWEFDNGSGTIASDGWGRSNGTLANFNFDSTDGWQPSTKCISGGCLKFDGTDDYVSITNNLTGGLSAITIEAWVNGQQASSLIRAQNNAFILHFRGAGFYLVGADGTVSNYLGWNTTLPFNTWIHVLATWDNNRMYIYLNGVKQASSLAFTGGSTRKLLSSTWTQIGNYFNAGQPYFRGSIDTIRIYGAALPSAQIKEIYYTGLNSLLEKSLISKESYLEKVSIL